MTERSMASTREGDTRWYYSREVEIRPFSRFTADPAEIQANMQWAERASIWGEQNFDMHGHRIVQGVIEQYYERYRN